MRTLILSAALVAVFVQVPKADAQAHGSYGGQYYSAPTYSYGQSYALPSYGYYQQPTGYYLQPSYGYYQQPSTSYYYRQSSGYYQQPYAPYGAMPAQSFYRGGYATPNYYGGSYGWPAGGRVYRR